jgi:uncharacterized protein (DUF2141 family)
LAIGVAAGGLSVARAQTAPVIVEVTGVRSSEGVVRVDVCTPATFLKTICSPSGLAPAVEGTTTITVEHVPPGVYAVQAYHDRNDNDRLDRGMFGIPREDFGFSNDPPLGFRGPSFARSSFTHGAEAQTIRLRLRHFGDRGPASLKTPPDVAAPLN